MKDVLLEVQGLKKSFGGVAALKNGEFRLKPGSVHALCGGNGAGKSTFLTIIMGIQARDAGTIKRDGVEVVFDSPGDALKNGIAIIEQEMSPIPAMSVAENIFLGREPLASFGRVNFSKMNRAAQDLLDQLGFSIRATDVMMNLSVAKLQLVEIAKALSYDAQIIIMDEPTSALGEAEVDQLFEAIRALKARGKGIIYVSHRLSEIFSIADTYTVFRDGAFIAQGAIADIDKNKLIHMIVGRPLTEEFVKNSSPSETVSLELREMRVNNKDPGVSFSAHAGEILAIYGLMGSGRSEIFERLFGLSPNYGGKILIDGKAVKISNASEAIANGMAFITEDRKGSGLVMSGTVRENICLAHLPKMGVGPLVSANQEFKAARTMIDMFDIKTASDQLLVSELSGGNQQKVVLAKWFLTEPQILLLDEPTRGVDVGAKREIYRIMSQFAEKGGTVILVSSETEEVLGMADRVLVMRGGAFTAELGRNEMSAAKMVHLAA
ncbi:Ribose ABC transport system, ATP-binding protein RbsA (TC 3.A.1.2.1) [hydrothermal vent metagenome]|uniref:Ribose ABC transport system, ATP-binding protein RbsA (TC 3.A.1.2.1) n=1 Tax=hydrothermal vent metagenome TaxID=652676 RepID=A0A3B0TRE6_9ZZZZ